MKVIEMKSQLDGFMQQPRVRLGVLIVLVLFIMWMLFSWWQWQASAVRNEQQALKQFHELQKIVDQLPDSGQVVTSTEEMFVVLKRYPLHQHLEGHIVDVRAGNDQLKATILNAPAMALFAWLDQLTQSGMMVSRLSITRSDDVGTVSGSVVWGGQ